MLPQVSQSNQQPASHESVADQQPSEQNTAPTIKQADNRLFRQDALESYVKGAASEGAVFEAEPSWIRSSFWALIAGALLLFLFVCFGRVHEYASGPAIIHVGEQVEVTAVTDANIGKLLVSAGQQVNAGQAIVQLYQGQAIADYQRLKSEFELRLRQRLMAPDDTAVESALISLQADLELARTNLDQRTVHADISGTVGDIRIRPGQRISAGQVLLSINSNDDDVRIIAFLPGQYRPQIQPGMRVRLALDGYPYGYQYVEISDIADEIIGPAEAKQFAGGVIGDVLNIDGPNFIVEARLDSASFTSENKTYAFHNGMHGLAEAQVASESILMTLFPSLKKLFR